MAHKEIIIQLEGTILLILAILFPFSNAQNNTEYFESILSTAVQEEIIGLTTKNSSNPYAKYIFGLPPIPIDPSIVGVESDDDFETLAPFAPDFIYNKDWFISGFDKENRPILLQTFPRVGTAFHNLFSNSTALKLFSKLTRYRQYILLKALKIRSTKIKPVTQYVKLNDFINANSYGPLFTNPTGSRWVIHRIALDRQFLEKYQKTEIVLNVGVVGEIIGRILTRVAPRRRSIQVYGPDKARWQQALQKQFPRDALPEEYGGFRGHVPIKLYPD